MAPDAASPSKIKPAPCDRQDDAFIERKSALLTCCSGSFRAGAALLKRYRDMTQATTQVPSLNPPHQVETSGFELADHAAHMLAWLGKGEDSRQFVVSDIEDGIYRQAPDSQVLEVRCNDKPELTTAVQSDNGDSRATVDGFRVTFPLTVRVKTPGAVWKLDVQHSYEATDRGDNDGQTNVRMHFAVQSHEQEA
jgi:hypothetical protein